MTAVIDLTVPPSVNATRRINRAARPIIDAWQKTNDMALMASGQHKGAKVEGPFELEIVLCERRCACDPDNIVKAAVDYLRRIELIRDDSPQYFRKLTITWGEAPKGCRMVLRPVP